MKRILAAVLASATIFSNVALADLYIGADKINGDALSNSITTESGGSISDYDSTESGYRLKLGFGKLDDWAFQLYYASLNADKDYLLYTSKTITEIGYDVKPGWKLADNLYFAIPFGVDYGWTELNDPIVSQSSWFRVGAKVGVSLSYVVASQIELTVGYDYKMALWQPIEIKLDTYFSETITQTSTGSGLYFGVNFWFGNAITQTLPDRTESYEEIHY